MENISKFLGLAFNVVVFFIAVTILYAMSHQYNELVEASMDNIPSSDMVYEAEPIYTDNHVSRAEITALLMGQLDYDVEVINAAGSFTITAFGYCPDFIGSYPLTSNLYDKSYLYNMNGTISKIVFQYVP